MRESYGLILLDLVLGKEDGLAILRRIRARQRAPIVIISAKSDSTDIITGLELGADDYVPKRAPNSPLIMELPGPSNGLTQSNFHLTELMGGRSSRLPPKYVGFPAEQH